MGCDIHIFAETRNKKTGKWKITGDEFTLDEYLKISRQKEKSRNPFQWRDYIMFSLFAGVRNGYHIKPISMPRGIPKDVSKEIKEEWEFWNGDAHSESYLTAKELLEYDYNCGLNAHRIKDYLGEIYFQNLRELESLGNPNDVRIVFWFDN